MREHELQQQGDRQDEVEEDLQHDADAQNPHATGAGEEDLRHEAVEDEDEQDELKGGGAELWPEAVRAAR